MKIDKEISITLWNLWCINPITLPTRKFCQKVKQYVDGFIIGIPLPAGDVLKIKLFNFPDGKFVMIIQKLSAEQQYSFDVTENEYNEMVDVLTNDNFFEKRNLSRNTVING